MPTRRKLIHNPSEIPEFKNEAEEADFWAEHSFGEKMFDAAEHDPEAQRLLALIPTRVADEPALSRPENKSRPTSIRLGGDLERRLRKLAQLKGVPYQTLLREFVQERVYEEEKRHRVI